MFSLKITTKCWIGVAVLLAPCVVAGLTEEAKAGVTLGPRAMVMVSNDAIIRLRLAKGCCCSDMLNSPSPGNCRRLGPTDLSHGERWQNNRRGILRVCNWNVKGR